MYTRGSVLKLVLSGREVIAEECRLDRGEDKAGIRAFACVCVCV